MPILFSPSPTAEQVIAVVDAVVVHQGSSSVQVVADFSDLPLEQAESALMLGDDLGFLTTTPAGEFEAASPLCRFVASPVLMQKATVLWVLLESYPPFIMFRRRLVATDLPGEAARQTKAILQLAAHHEDIKSTLISLGTYSQALSTEGGGRYEVRDAAGENALEVLLQGCGETASAERRVRQQLGVAVEDVVSRDQVIAPLADALQRAGAGDSRGAVMAAGNAVESYITDLAHRLGISLSGSGLNAKIDEIARAQPQKMPTKIRNVGKYLGHVRNAADHGIDAEIGVQWTIRHATGVEYVFVACSFVAATMKLALGHAPEI